MADRARESAVRTIRNTCLALRESAGTWTATFACAVAVCTATAACSVLPTEPSLADIPTTPKTSVQSVLQGSTIRRADMTEAQIACARNTGLTHAHPSWHGFEDAVMESIGTERYQITFTDVPVDRLLQITVWDQNWCDTEPLGFVKSGMSANGLPLKQNWFLDVVQPGFEFSVDASGRVRQ